MPGKISTLVFRRVDFGRTLPQISSFTRTDKFHKICAKYLPLLFYHVPAYQPLIKLAPDVLISYSSKHIYGLRKRGRGRPVPRPYIYGCGGGHLFIGVPRIFKYMGIYSYSNW